MPRNAKKDLRKLNPDSSEYWSEVLRREGLTMDAGRNKKLVYVGSTKTLEDVSEGQQDNSGRVTSENSEE